MFNKEVEAKQKVLLEQELIDSITSKIITENRETKLVENSVINRFVEKFNETYNQELLSEQKELLSKYINSGEDDLELKLYLNEELGRLKTELNKLTATDSSGNAKKIYESLNSLRINDVNEDLIKKFMYTQQFVHEVNS